MLVLMKDAHILKNGLESLGKMEKLLRALYLGKCSKVLQGPGRKDLASFHNTPYLTIYMLIRGISE